MNKNISTFRMNLELFLWSHARWKVWSGSQWKLNECQMGDAGWANHRRVQSRPCLNYIPVFNRPKRNLRYHDLLTHRHIRRLASHFWTSYLSAKKGKHNYNLWSILCMLWLYIFLYYDCTHFSATNYVILLEKMYIYEQNMN